MKDTYRINHAVLKNKQTSFNGEKTSFIQGAYKTFSNGYLELCNDPSIQQMCNKLNERYSKIEKGYAAISNWFETYIQDSLKLESSLKDGTPNVTDTTTNGYLKGFVEYNKANIEESSNIVSKMGNNTYQLLNSNTETTDEVDYESIRLEKESFVDTMNSVKKDLQTEKEKLSSERQKELDELGHIEPPSKGNHQGNEAYQKYKSIIYKYSKLTDDIDSQLLTVEMLIREAENDIELLKYNELMDTDEYKKFVEEYNSLSTYVGPDALKDQVDTFDYLAEYEKNGPTVSKYELIEGEFKTELTIADLSRYATEQEKMMYHYLVQTRGQDDAKEFLLKIVDNINMMKGAEIANGELYDLRTTIEEEETTDSAIMAMWAGLSNSFQTWGMGLIDGSKNFFTGITKWFSNDKHISAEQYAKMFEVQYMYEHHYGSYYEVGSITGNILPALAISVVTRAGLLGIAVPTELATLYGETLGVTSMGLSAGGNAKEYAMQYLGATPTSALLYGFLIGASESLLGRYLGKLPFLSETSGFTLANLLSEGTEEWLQDWIAAGLQAVMYGKTINIDELTEESFKSFFMGILMAGMMNGSSTIIKMKMHGIDMEVDMAKIREKLQKLTKDNKGSVALSLLLGDAVITKVNIDELKQAISQFECPYIEDVDDVQSAFGEWGKKKCDALSSELKSDVNEYSNELYKWINNKLRENPKFTNQQIENISKAIQTSKLEQDVYAYRVMSKESLKKVLKTDSIENLDSLVGKVYHDDGFSSTTVLSFEYNPNEEIRKYWSQKEVTIEFLVPKGTNGLYIESLSASPDEYELLLDKGVTGVVYGVYEEDGRYCVQVLIK